MSDAGRRADALGIFLTGGAGNADPDASLGGAPSTTRIRGLGALVADPVPALRIDNVLPACGEGEATLQVNAAGSLVFTPPGGSAGAPVPIADGESKLVTGVDDAKGVVVFREAGLAIPPGATSTLTLVNALTGAMSMRNVTDSERIAGETTYRAIILEAQGAFGVLDIRCWLPSVVALQGLYHIGEEAVVGGVIQTIADEFTAPAGIGWVNPNSELFALEVPVLHPGDKIGLWIRRIFPAAGVVSVAEDLQLLFKFKGA